MSIAPVDSFPPVSEQSASPGIGSGHSQARSVSSLADDPAQPVSRTLSKPETAAVRSIPAAYELPQDVVEVHQDPDIRGQVIIQYLDQAKDVVLQVPSDQELGVERGIAQEFQQEAKLRASATTPTTEREGETHGD